MPDPESGRMGPRDEISRRHFLGLGATAATLFLMGPKKTLGQRVPGKDPIVVATNGSPGQLVSGALQALGGIENFVQPGDFVLVKPNASFSRVEANTNPEVAAAVINLCLKAGAKRVVLADHPLHHPDNLATRMLRDAAKASGAEFVFLGERDSDYEKDFGIPGGKALESVDRAKLYSESDVLINLPVLKHHSATGACVGLKNLMGLVQDRQVFHFPGPLHECIADLSLAIKADLTIVDATRVLASNGPGGPGEVLPIGNVIAGVDPVAVDVASLELVSSLGGKYSDFTVDENRYIAEAADLGIGDGDPDSVRLNRIWFDVTRENIVSPGEFVIDEGEGLPNWLPYASLSAAAIALGLAATIYDRRKTRHG